MVAGLLIAAFALTHSSRVTASPTLQTLYSFTGGVDGQNPYAGLVMDGSGALYGTTPSGGTDHWGVVFKLTPPSVGQTVWTETVLHSFTGGDDGALPIGGLIMDRSGALYGTADLGCRGHGGCVFKLTPPAAGKIGWTETVLHAFNGGAGGAYSHANVIMDSAGALYGTTQLGGLFGYGVVFKLTPPVAGRTAWTETVLHGFTNGKDGGEPVAGVILDNSGAVYGTTSQGGTDNFGVVFKLTPPAAGNSAWTETVLHSFTNEHDGAEPEAGVIMDGSGALYGTTNKGGNNAFGVVFKLTPPAAGKNVWAETVLGRIPTLLDGSLYGGLIMDGAGAVYGAAIDQQRGYGGIFKLTPPVAGRTAWTETFMHNFTGPDGANPTDSVIKDGFGALYGSTQDGGEHNQGTIFKLTP